MTAVDVRTLAERVGEEIAVSDWLTIRQDRIDRFADAIDDHQWIHVDPARAAASPFKGTIAHGFLTLSVTSALARLAMTFEHLAMAVNYGLNRVRFPTPVPSGAQVRGRFTLSALEPIEHGVQVTWSVIVELQGASKPCCVAEWIVRYYPER